MGIGRRFFTIGGLTFVSRIFGVIREAAFSHFLGASSEMDAFLIAFKFPSFFRKFFAEGGFQSIFVPYYTDYNMSKKCRAARLFASKIFTFVCYVSLFSTLVVCYFAREFVCVMAPGFCGDQIQLEMAVEFTRIIFPSIVFISISSIYSGILIASKRFFAFAMSPILINIVLISFLIFGESISSAGKRISYGVLAAGVFQFCYICCCIKYNHIGLPSFSRLKISGKIKQFFKKLLPILVGAGVAQINIFTDSLLGSLLPTGTISYIYFADRFIQFPLALFGISIGIILLPEISRNIAHKKTDYVDELQNEALSFALRMTLPLALSIMSLAYFLVSILYGHGKFTELSVRQTANILRVFAIGLPAYVAAKIISFVMFAKKDSRTPIIAAIISVACNFILSIVLMMLFQGLGIAIATSVAGFVNAYVMHRKSHCSVSIGKGIYNVLVACGAMLICLEILKSILMEGKSSVCEQITSLLLICFGGAIAYVGTLFVLKDEATRIVVKKLKTKWGRSGRKT
jgi:putative peptidoglycan lipid II flippase